MIVVYTFSCDACDWSTEAACTEAYASALCLYHMKEEHGGGVSVLLRERPWTAMAYTKFK
jgi:hypothetical protein